MTYLWGIKYINMRINTFSLSPNWLKRILFLSWSLTHPRLLTAFLLLSGSSLDFARQDQEEGKKAGLQPGAGEVFPHGPGIEKGVSGRVMGQRMGDYKRTYLKGWPWWQLCSFIQSGKDLQYFDVTLGFELSSLECWMTTFIDLTADAGTARDQRGCCLYFLFFWGPCLVACGMLFPQPGIEPWRSAVN